MASAGCQLSHVRDQLVALGIVLDQPLSKDGRLPGLLPFHLELGRAVAKLPLEQLAQPDADGVGVQWRFHASGDLKLVGTLLVLKHASPIA